MLEESPAISCLSTSDEFLSFIGQFETRGTGKAGIGTPLLFLGREITFREFHADIQFLESLSQSRADSHIGIQYIPCHCSYSPGYNGISNFIFMKNQPPTGRSSDKTVS